MYGIDTLKITEVYVLIFYYPFYLYVFLPEEEEARLHSRSRQQISTHLQSGIKR